MPSEPAERLRGRKTNPSARVPTLQPRAEGLYGKGQRLADPDLTTQALREYVEYTAKMVQQLTNSQHLEEAKQARELYRLLDRLVADRRAERS